MTDETGKNNLESRPPVVVILGHVDHGKTSILDKIRQSRVAQKESGGITQHIGAYQVGEGDAKITFLDTPGHEAFSAIRSRGVKVADIAVLVVAADEGVKPQTKEAIGIIKETATPFIVAVNKIDKDGANTEKIKQSLAENEVFVEGYGGDVPIVELSAKTGQGIEGLLEMITLVAQLQSLRAKTGGPAEGLVIESHLDKRRGLVATLIVQEGILKIGDWLVSGKSLAKVKALEDFLGKSIKEAAPSQPCLVLGWESLPALGQEFEVVADRHQAEEKAGDFKKEPAMALFAGNDKKLAKTANFIIKADVQSSLEAISQALASINSEEAGFKITAYGLGNISDSDIKNAKTTDSSVIGFRVAMEDSVKQLSEREGIRVEVFDIIYEFIEKVREMMSELLEPEIKRTALGKVRVLALFGSKSAGEGKSQIIGGKVTSGKAVRGAMIEVARNGSAIVSGRLGQLQQGKNDVPEVSEGLELGIRFDANKTAAKTEGGKTQGGQIEIGDILEIYQEEKIARSI